VVEIVKDDSIHLIRNRRSKGIDVNLRKVNAASEDLPDEENCCFLGLEIEVLGWAAEHEGGDRLRTTM